MAHPTFFITALVALTPSSGTLMKTLVWAHDRSSSNEMSKISTIGLLRVCTQFATLVIIATNDVNVFLFLVGSEEYRNRCRVHSRGATPMAASVFLHLHELFLALKHLRNCKIISEKADLCSSLLPVHFYKSLYSKNRQHLACPRSREKPIQTKICVNIKQFARKPENKPTGRMKGPGIPSFVGH